MIPMTSYEPSVSCTFLPVSLSQKAKKKPMEEVDPASLDLDLKDLNSRLTVLSVEDPPVREAGSKVADVDELVSKLKEAGVV